MKIYQIFSVISEKSKNPLAEGISIGYNNFNNPIIFVNEKK